MADLPLLTTPNNAASPSTTGRGATPTTAGPSGSPSTTAGLPTTPGSNNPSSSASTSVISGAPSLQTGPLSLPTNLPTLSGHYSYPPPTVPPTANAPYMQSSDLPQNFVFIVVGACILFIALIILAWRFLTAWSINRNVKRDAQAYTPLMDVKKRPTKNESSHDLADLSAKLPSSFNSVPSLFFSPTAEAARQSMIRPASQHMPAGHYRDASR